MPDLIDVNKLVQDIKDAVSGVINEDVTTLSGFQERQVKDMAKRAAQIAEFTIKGEIDEEQRKFFLEDLARDAKTFAKVVVAMVAITIEKVWNAVVEIIWGAINGAVDTAIGSLPLPKFPVGG